eukprot:scaffold148_cov144-Isochrysis_galbana.AAC.3
MSLRRPAEPCGGALNHPATASRSAAVSSTSCGKSDRNTTSVPARGATSVKEGGAPAGAVSAPPSLCKRSRPPSASVQDGLAYSRYEKLRSSCGVPGIESMCLR